MSTAIKALGTAAALFPLALLGVAPSHAATEVWLVITLYQPGLAPIQLEDARQPDLLACWARAAEAVENAAKVTGEFEFAASCSVHKTEDDPA